MAEMEFDAPIPGENFTSDTKNYPWHRPPQFDELDDAIEFAAEKILDPDNAHGLLMMMQMGADIVTLVDTFLTAGIGAGKWTPDFAILMAGPLAHIMLHLGKGAGLDPKIGIENKKPKMTKAFFEGRKMLDAEVDEAIGAVDVDAIIDGLEKTPMTGGFMNMSMPAMDEEML